MLFLCHYEYHGITRAQQSSEITKFQHLLLSRVIRLHWLIHRTPLSAQFVFLHSLQNKTTNFQEKKAVRPTFSAEHIFGGTLLAMCSSDFICFYDWAECRLIRRIDVTVTDIAVEAQDESKWKQLGELAMSTGKLEMAEKCMRHAMGLSGLLLLYSSLGDADGLTKLGSTC